MAMHSGVVKGVFEKDWNGKKFYTLNMTNLDKGVGFGTHNPRVNPGDQVEFEMGYNDKGYPTAKGGSLRVVQKGAEIAAQGPSAAAVGASAMGKDDYWKRKEDRDTRQDELREIGATRNTAIEWVKFLIEREALKVPTKAADKEAFFNELLQNYIDTFRGKTTTPILKAKAAPTIQVTPEEPPVAGDDDGNWN